MSVVGARNSRSLAFTVALAILFALVIPFAGAALAGHAPEHRLEVTPETLDNPVGSNHTLTATIAGAAPAGGVQVDFEIDCLTNCAATTYTLLNNATGGSPAAGEAGGPIQPVDTPTDANQAPEALDDTRATPELSCTIPATDTACQVVYSRNTTGTEEVAAWIDEDVTNAAGDSDTAEQRDETTVFGAGNTGEADDTDVVAKSWFSGVVTAATLDCDDDDNVDTETNPAGQAEIYICTLFNDNGAGTGGVASNGVQDGTEAAIAGVLIDGEFLATSANDPDNGSTTPVDISNGCTTAANGTCQITVSPSETEVGTANVCFWADEDNDSEFSLTGGEQDGGGCDEETATNETGIDDSNSGTGLTNGRDNDSDITDVVEKIWAAAGTAATLNAEPEVDSNAAGTQHSVTATVTDQFGAAVGGIPVDFNILGRNDQAGPNPECNQVITNAQGVATCNYTDKGVVADPIAANASETDHIVACVDANLGVGDNVCDNDTGTAENAATTPAREVADADMTDTVTKFWFNTVPAASTLIVDMAGANVGACAIDDPGPYNNPVGTPHGLCAIVSGPDGPDGGTDPDLLPGKTVTFTKTGPGEFFVDADGDNVLDTGEGRGQTFTTTTDEAGEALAVLISNVTGTITVTATADSVSDTGTKTYTSLPGRILDCNPETATNAPGTEHVITCVVTDKLGNPRPGQLIVTTETGPGRFQEEAQPFLCPVNARCVTTDAQGSVDVRVATSTVESGTQTITMELAEDFAEVDGPNDIDDDCDQAGGFSPDNTNQPNDAGTAPDVTPGVPAGVCEDTVTKTWEEATPPPVLETGPCSGFAEGTRTARSTGGFVIVGTSGNDVLDGSGGPDLICGLGGDDVIDGRGSNDKIAGGGGNDNIGGGRGKDNITGGAGDDVISGNRGNDVIKGNGGNDNLKGNAGIDTLSGGGGSDTLQGGDGNDVLKGGDGNDTLRGGDGADSLDGGGGRDQCFGNAGNDTVRNCE